MPQSRRLAREDLSAIWSIDRSETATHAYRLVDGKLVLAPLAFDLKGWPKGMRERDEPELEACFERGGAFLGMFDGEPLVGVAVVDTLPLGPDGDQLQLEYLYVSRSHRGRGIGQALFREAQSIARERGARVLYISATPTQATVDFYMRCGAVVARWPDPELLAREPKDIHMICQGS